MDFTLEVQNMSAFDFKIHRISSFSKITSNEPMLEKKRDETDLIKSSHISLSNISGKEDSNVTCGKIIFKRLWSSNTLRILLRKKKMEII